MSLQAIFLVGTGGALGAGRALWRWPAGQVGLRLSLGNAKRQYYRFFADGAGDGLGGACGAVLQRQCACFGQLDFWAALRPSQPFSLELVSLLERRELLAAGGYLGGSVLGGVAGLFIGYSLVRQVDVGCAPYDGKARG